MNILKKLWSFLLVEEDTPKSQWDYVLINWRELAHLNSRIRLDPASSCVLSRAITVNTRLNNIDGLIGKLEVANNEFTEQGQAPALNIGLSDVTTTDLYTFMVDADGYPVIIEQIIPRIYQSLICLNDKINNSGEEWVHYNERKLAILHDELEELRLALHILTSGLE